MAFVPLAYSLPFIKGSSMLTDPDRDQELQQFSISFAFPVIFTEHAFHFENDTLANLLAAQPSSRPSLVLLAIDTGVHAHWPNLVDSILHYLRTRTSLRPILPPLVITGGEAAKEGWHVVEEIARRAAAEGLDRHSYLFAIGGGAMLDAVGLAASLIHRGVRLVRFPTTVLAQGDAGVGVKNGVNFAKQKNFLGCFDPPYAVINDLAFLDTLPERDWRAGLAEAVKVAAIKDLALLEILEREGDALSLRNRDAMATVVRRCCHLHLEHTRTSGDPFERGSARPLDFGHWSAHWLEVESEGALRHGEAVAIGIAIDSTYASRRGYLSRDESHRILACLRQLGFSFQHPLLTRSDSRGRLAVLQGLEHFREHLGGELTLTLPSPLGNRIEVHEVDLGEMEAAIREVQGYEGQ